MFEVKPMKQMRELALAQACVTLRVGHPAVALETTLAVARHQDDATGLQL